MTQRHALLGSALLFGALLPGLAASQPAPPRPGPRPASATPVVIPARQLNPAARRRLIEAAIVQLRQRYVFPARVPAIARALRTALATPAVKSAVDGQALAVALNRTLARAADDRHLRFLYAPEPLPRVPPGGEPDPAELTRMQAAMARRNFAMARADLLPGNIGYLKIDLFARPERAGPTFAAAMAFLAHSDAMIVDLRDNGGGDPGMVAFAASYFVPPETLLNSFHNRGETTDQQSWSLPAVPGGRWSTAKPLYILAGPDTASGAEEFAYDLQMLKRATIVGRPTWGGANPGGMFPLDDHFAMFIPLGAAINPISKTNWEGVGVRPDVAAAPEATLETAHRMALNAVLAHASGDQAQEVRAALSGLEQ